MQAILLAIQFVVAAEQIEAEAPQQKARLAAQLATPKLLTWGKLQTLGWPHLDVHQYELPLGVADSYCPLFACVHVDL